MKQNIAKALKRYLKRKINLSFAVIVAFLITGNIGYAALYKEGIVGDGTKAPENIINGVWSVNAAEGQEEYKYALVAANGGVYDVTAENIKEINIINKGREQDTIGLVAASGKVNIGNKNTVTNINVVANKETGNGYGIWAYEGNKVSADEVNISGKSLNINLEANGDAGYGIGTTAEGGRGDNSKININSDNTIIKVTGEAKYKYGVASWKGANIKINSKNLIHISADKAIDILGNAYVGVNENSQKADVKLEGNIQVRDNNETISRGNGVVVNFTTKDSYLNGNVVTGHYNSEDKDVVRLSFTNGANWNMNGGSSLSGTVTLQGGTINLGTNGGLSISGNGLVMNGTGEGYDSIITGKGNINSSISVNNQGNIFNLAEGSKLIGDLTLSQDATAQNRGYLALGKDSSILVGQGATFTNEEGATIKGTVNNQNVIEVAGGTAINNGTIDLTGTTGSTAMYATKDGSTLTNNGTIKVDYKDNSGSKVFGEANNVTSTRENTNAGKIQINGYKGGTSSTDKEKLDDLLLGSGATNTGMYVDDTGKAIMFGNTIAGEINVNDALGKIEAGKLQIGQAGATIKADGNNIIGKEGYLSSINIAGDLKLASNNVSNVINIENVVTNTDSTSKIIIGSGLTANFVKGTINGADSKPAISIEKDGTLGLKDMTVNGDIVSDYASFEQPGTDGKSIVSMDGTNTINGNVDVSNININSGETKFTSNSSFGGKMDNHMISKDGVAIFEIGENGENALLNTSNKGNSITINGKFGITPDNLTKDETIDLGKNNNLNDAEFISKADKTQDVYLTNLDKTNNTIYAKYNKELLLGYGNKLNDINNSFQVINDKISQNKLDRVDLANKVYAGTIYAETVRMAYDNNKLVENELLKLNPEVATGEWAVNGKALYMKNEYTREGVVADYKSEKESTGLLASAEYGLNDTTNLGFAFAGINHKLDTDTGKADGDAFYLGAFAKKEVGNYRLTAGLGYEFNRFDADENIFGGSEKYDANVYSAYVEGRYSKDLGDNLTFEPKLKLGYTYVDQDAVEDGTYKLDSQDISVFDTEIGADLVKTVALKDGRLDVVFGASYAMVFGDTDDEFEGRFVGADGTLSSSFNMVGANLAERSANFGLGLGVTKDSGMFYNGGVTFKAGSDNYRDYGVTLGAGYKF